MYNYKVDYTKIAECNIFLKVKGGFPFRTVNKLWLVWGMCIRRVSIGIAMASYAIT